MATEPDIWMWVRACAVLEQMPGQFTHSQAGNPPSTPPDDLHIFVTNSGYCHVPVRSPAAAIRRLEIPYGRFERQVRLPAGRFHLERSQIASGRLHVTPANRS